MACGNCSCGNNQQHTPKKASKSAWVAVIAGMMLGGVALVGAAMAFQPGAASPPATKPTEPAPSPATPAATNPESPATPTAPAKSDDKSTTTTISPYVLNHTAKRLDGTEEKLDVYKGKVVLVVNVASKCGNTPQYAGLQKLFNEKKDAGLVVLGFPSGDFRNQELGTSKEIAEFCSSKYQITFPMFERVSVKGADAHPLFKQLVAQPAPIGVEPDWNFTKYLIDRQGNVVARFSAKTKPDNTDLVKQIDELLKVKG